MRFRAKLIDIGCIQHFTRIIGTVSKLGKSCVLRITPDKLYFILSEKAINGGIQIWCELPQVILQKHIKGYNWKLIFKTLGHFFDEYAMEGVSVEEANEIYVELIPDNLMKALKTAQSAKWVKVKLTKKTVPCITLEVELPSMSSHERLVVHDIPVNVIARRLWPEYEEPELPNFEVSICLPQLKVMRNILDKMKNLSNYIVLSANHNGDMDMSVEADMVSVSTHFRDLVNPTWKKDAEAASQGEATPSEKDPRQFFEARVDIRKFAQFISCQQVTPTRIVCNIENGQSVHLYLMHDDLSLQYFMPAISL